jgi:lysophospholipase L1-like esterase
MVFENQNLEILAHNFIDIKKDKTGFIYFERFTNEQFETLAKNPLFQMMGQSTAGIFLFFKTNGNEISFQCKKESILKNVIPILRYGGAKIIETAKTSMSPAKRHGGRLKMNDAFDIYINGERVASPKPRSGHIRVSFQNNTKSDVFVKIYFPLYTKVGIMNLTSNGPIETIAQQKEKIYCLGDSITQGFDSGNPSLCYVARIAEMLNLDALNQGVGRFQYDPAILNGLEKLSDPKFITIAYGTNDWAYNPEIESIQLNISNFYKKINSLFPKIPIFVITPFWRSDMEQVMKSGKYTDVVQLIENESNKYSNLVLIDGLKISPHEKTFYSDGRLHPNIDGFAYIAERLAPILTSALKN